MCISFQVMFILELNLDTLCNVACYLWKQSSWCSNFVFIWVVGFLLKILAFVWFFIFVTRRDKFFFFLNCEDSTWLLGGKIFEERDALQSKYQKLYQPLYTKVCATGYTFSTSITYVVSVVWWCIINVVKYTFAEIWNCDWGCWSWKGNNWGCSSRPANWIRCSGYVSFSILSWLFLWYDQY